MDDEGKRALETLGRELAIRELELIDHLCRELGETVLDSVARFENARMERIWTPIGAKEGGGARALARILWSGLGGEAGFEFSLDTSAPGVVSVRCTRCPFADHARSRGLQDAGYARYCAGDWGIARGFDPRVRLTRTKTLMRGDDCCDHRYEEVPERAVENG
jgi:hypothetical protein